MSKDAIRETAAVEIGVQEAWEGQGGGGDGFRAVTEEMHGL